MPVRGKRAHIRGQKDRSLLLPAEAEFIIQAHGLHDHTYLMIAVFPASYDIQAEIDLGHRF